MKLKIITLILGVFTSCKGFSITPPKTILECLGVEEAKIHSAKIDGAIMKLNQRLVDYFSQEQNLKLKPEYLQKICKYNQFTPSTNFLKTAVLEEKKIFLLQSEDDAIRFEEFFRELTNMFILYFSDLQIKLPLADCLSDEIPELNSFINEYRYLESNLDFRYFFRDKTKLSTIFQKLENFETIVSKCEKKKKTNDKKNKKKQAK